MLNRLLGRGILHRYNPCLYSVWCGCLWVGCLKHMLSDSSCMRLLYSMWLFLPLLPGLDRCCGMKRQSRYRRCLKLAPSGRLLLRLMLMHWERHWRCHFRLDVIFQIFPGLSGNSRSSFQGRLHNPLLHEGHGILSYCIFLCRLGAGCGRMCMSLLYLKLR